MGWGCRLGWRSCVQFPVPEKTKKFNTLFLLAVMLSVILWPMGERERERYRKRRGISRRRRKRRRWKRKKRRKRKGEARWRRGRRIKLWGNLPNLNMWKNYSLRLVWILPVAWTSHEAGMAPLPTISTPALCEPSSPSRGPIHFGKMSSFCKTSESSLRTRPLLRIGEIKFKSKTWSLHSVIV